VDFSPGEAGFGSEAVALRETMHSGRWSGRESGAENLREFWPHSYFRQEASGFSPEIRGSSLFSVFPLEDLQASLGTIGNSVKNCFCYI
jgi:hypothetical protein